MNEICSSLLLTTGHLAYFTVLITAVFSFFLRVSLNYFHFSISQLNKIPRILSMIGPFVCEYHQWVIGTYLAAAIFVLPLNWELFRVIGFLGLVLIGLLLFYGSQKAVYNLSSGVIVASIFLLSVLFIMAMWEFGGSVRNRAYRYIFAAEQTETKKKQDWSVCFSHVGGWKACWPHLVWRSAFASSPCTCSACRVCGEIRSGP